MVAATQEEMVHIEELPERVAGGVGHLRDRTAELISADSDSVLRAVSDLRGQLDAVEERLGGRVDRATSGLGTQLDALARRGRRTTFPRKLFWLLVGAGAGAVAAMLADPDRGRARRAQLSDQASSRGRKQLEEARNRAKIASDRMRGQVIERAKGVLPERPEDDFGKLDQRIRSEVFGHRDDVNEVVLRIDAPGKVALKGTVPSPESERELLAAVAEVEGVVDVTSELASRTP